LTCIIGGTGWRSKITRAARGSFIAETVRLLRLGVAKVVPVRSRLLAECWPLVERHHIYEADALQIVSAKHLGVDQLLPVTKDW
jgi:predicted nucleic acid-binding protein